MTKWEYKDFNRRLDTNELNKLGKEGWELVSHTAVVASNIFGTSGSQYYVFKRELT